MRKLILNNWKEKNSCLELFVEALDEMLFYYSFDSYQFPALNLKYLCYEINTTIELINQGILQEGNIIPLFYEFKSFFEDDSVCGDKYGKDVFDLLVSNRADIESCIDKKAREKFKNNFISSNKKHIIKRLESITDFFIEILGDDYFATVKDKITIAVSRQNINSYDEKDEIYKLSKTLVTELMNFGYSQEYIYQILHQSFVVRQRKKLPENHLKSFFEGFTFEQKEYTVNIKFKTESQALVELICKNNNEIKIVNENEISYITNQLDQFRAYMNAKTSIDFYQSLYNFTTHKKEENPIDTISIKEDQVDYIIEDPPNYFIRLHGINKSTDSIVESFPHPDYTSYIERRIKILTAVKLHHVALNSNQCSNQLLNLWTCLEILIDPLQNENISRINQISNVLTSVLSSIYIKSLFKCFYNDLCRFHGKKTVDNIVKKNSDLCDYENIALVILKIEDSATDNPFYGLLESHQLLKYRFENLKNSFRGPNKIKETLIRHKQKLEWHIMRMYRTRNSIIHAGASLPFMQTIVKNLHYYVDTLIEVISSKEFFGLEPENCYTQIRLSEIKHFKFLDDTTEFEEDSNILKCMFWCN